MIDCSGIIPTSAVVGGKACVLAVRLGHLGIGPAICLTTCSEPAWAAGGEIDLVSGFYLFFLIAGLPSFAAGWLLARLLTPSLSALAVATLLLPVWGYIVFEKGVYDGIQYAHLPVMTLSLVSPFIAAGWLFSRKMMQTS